MTISLLYLILTFQRTRVLTAADSMAAHAGFAGELLSIDKHFVGPDGT